MNLGETHSFGDQYMLSSLRKCGIVDKICIRSRIISNEVLENPCPISSHVGKLNRFAREI